VSVGIVVPLPAYTLDPAFIAKKAEDLGFESIWYHEHPILPVNSASPFPATGGEIPWTYRHFSDPYISLAMACAATTKIKLATGITLLPERNPLILAKMISVLDQHSNGRFIFGVGTGWNREETTMMGGDFDHRWTQAREGVLALKELWTKDEAEYHGRFMISRRCIVTRNRFRNLTRPSCWEATPPTCCNGSPGGEMDGCPIA
jgi:alkanesulfonate monooxygenase SsuD/methylene tetrahydromethanopterin reductase-like flavin-dependent oxidoreductase (luciferase family)